MAWHGRDLRQYKRLLPPPLERLLTCPGTAALGRGLASIPVSSLQEAGLPSTLSTLAEDAVTVGGLGGGAGSGEQGPRPGAGAGAGCRRLRVRRRPAR
jgi:hypothetical protein